jgi:Ca2+-binding EF-hand superfamily protein
MSVRGRPASAGESCGARVEKMADTPSTTASSNSQESRPFTTGGIRFNMHRLSKWFRDIDVKKTGRITQRELIVALRRHQGIQAMFCMMHGLEYAEVQAGSTGEAATQARRDEVHRIKAILREVDEDGSGTMEWTEFVEFFRRAGLLLEYEVHPALNRTSLCIAAEAQGCRDEQDDDALRKETIRRHATTKTYTPEMLNKLDVLRASVLKDSDLPLPGTPVRGSLNTSIF